MLRITSPSFVFSLFFSSVFSALVTKGELGSVGKLEKIRVYLPRPSNVLKLKEIHTDTSHCYKILDIL